jgi:hypothetical protein
VELLTIPQVGVRKDVSVWVRLSVRTNR